MPTTLIFGKHEIRINWGVWRESQTNKAWDYSPHCSYHAAIEVVF